MSKEKKTTLRVEGIIPDLRFPEFVEEGEWLENQLEKICDVNPRVSELPDKFVYVDLESVSNGILLKKNIIQKKVAPSRAQRLLKDKDVIYQMVRPYQKNNYYFIKSDISEYVASTGYAQLRAFDSSKYLFQLIHTDSFVSSVLEKCTGSNYPAINSSALKQIEVQMPPSKKEQQKIAACLSSLDDLIEAHNQKLETLKAHKKGLMQNLFPQKGAKVPKFRFPEFENDGVWEKKTLGKFAKFFSGGTPSKATPTFWGGTIPWISASSMYNINISQSKLMITKDAVESGARIVEEGTILILVRGSMLFNRIPIGITTKKVSFNQDVKAICLSKGYFTHYILYHLLAYENNIPIDKTGIGAGKIELNQLKNLSLYIPKSIKEQQKIATTLSNLDELINIQTKKNDQLKAHKKGLMQGLFPKKETGA